MPNEPKPDWEKEAVAFTNRHDLDVKLTLRHRRAVESALAEALREAHAAGAREAEEKRHPVARAKDIAAMTGSTLDARIRSLYDIRAKLLDEQDAVDVLIDKLEKEEGDASRVGGKETK
jgi:hypothetical protein